MAEVTLRGKIELDAEFVSNVLITAFDGNYGGCWYWAKPASDDWLTVINSGTSDMRWIKVEIIDKEDSDDPEPATHPVGAEQVALGITRMIEMGGQWAADAFGWISDQEDADIDAEGADVIVQFGLFSTIVYS